MWIHLLQRTIYTQKVRRYEVWGFNVCITKLLFVILSLYAVFLDDISNLFKLFKCWWGRYLASKVNNSSSYWLTVSNEVNIRIYSLRRYILGQCDVWEDACDILGLEFNVSSNKKMFCEISMVNQTMQQVAKVDCGDFQQHELTDSSLD